jgi:hypothetical protein
LPTQPKRSNINRKRSLAFLPFKTRDFSITKERASGVFETQLREVTNMPTAKEFAISLEDRPGTLGKLCQALGTEGVNILAYQQFPHEKGKGSVRLVVDNAAKAKAVLDRQRSDYKETEVAQVKLAHRPGELGRAASRLGDAGVNINYGYCGTEPNTNATFLIFGVAEVGKAVKILEQAAAAAATT